MTSAPPGSDLRRSVGRFSRVKRAVWILAAAAAVLVGACTSGDGLTLEPGSPPVVEGTVTAGAIDGGQPADEVTSGSAKRLVPAIGYECADGSMVYSTDTSHGRDGERWSVVYDAADELAQRC